MKKGILFIVALILFTSTSSFAGGLGYINNPDRYPSLGLSLGVTDMDGTNTRTFLDNLGIPIRDSVSTAQKTQDLTLDLRLPVSLTLYGAFSIISQELKSNEGIDFFSNDGTVDGFGFRIGARYYFNR